MLSLRSAPPLRSAVAGLWLGFCLGLPGAADVAAQTIYKCESPGQPSKYQNLPCDASEKTTTKARYAPPGASRGNEHAARTFCRIDEVSSEEVANHCLDQYRSSLLDARGAYIVSWEVGTLDGEKRVFVESRSRNKMGGPVASVLTCVLDENESVDVEATQGVVEFWSAIHGLDMEDTLPVALLKDC